jgi:LPS-assembly protein
LSPAAAQDAPLISTTPPVKSNGDGAVVITADGQNTYYGDIATADDNVELHYQDDVMFADHMTYDRSTRVVTGNGNVRLFSGGRVYRGESITYNLDTKAMTSAAFIGEEYPKLLYAKKVTTPGYNHYRLTNAGFTTSNRQNPSFHMEASTVEYRPNDEVVMKNVVLYVGQVPVFYFPVFVQSLTDTRPAYEFDIGNSGQFGEFIDNKYNWVISNKLRGTADFDFRSKRGYATGLDVQYFPNWASDILLKTYYAQDNFYSAPNPTVPNPVSHGDPGNSNVYDGVPFDNRYRIAYEHHLQFGPDFSSIADLNLWSDPWVTRDFFQGEYQQENQPQNFISLNQYNPNFTIDLLAMPQVNPFFETEERLPEAGLDVKDQKIFNSPVEYSSVNSVVNFQRHYADTSYFQNPGSYLYNSFPSTTAYDYYHPGDQAYRYNTAQMNNYSAYRYDTYQQLSLPHQYFNFLSLTPRIGARFTYYSDTNTDINDTVNNNGLSNDKITNGAPRLAADIGLEGDFKVSRVWENVQDKDLGIDGIRHVFEPFFNSIYAPSPTMTPNEFRGFDNQLYSTQLQPLDWTEYNSIDSIDKEAVVRAGFKNEIQTKRNGVNYDLLDWSTYGDVDFDHNFSASTPNGTFSDLFNDIRFYPTPQLQFHSLSAIDVADDGGYNEIDNDLIWAPDPSLQLTFGDHYINHSSIFADSNNVVLGTFYRMNEHWQFETQHQFEATNGRLQLQQYTIYRDLDSWQLAMTYSNSEINNGHTDQAIFFSLTLKAFPQYQLHTPRL